MYSSMPLLAYRFVSRPSGPTTIPSSLMDLPSICKLINHFPGTPVTGLADVSYTMLERKG